LILNQDFTYGKNFADFLGSFWSQLFDNGALGDAIGYASSEVLIQNYMDLVEIINSSSIYSVSVLSRKNVFPIIISKNKFTKISEIPSFGSGGYFGVQPSNSRYLENSYLRYGKPALIQESYFYPINNPALRSLGGIALNRLFEPSVTLSNNSDFLLIEEGIIFRENLFNNSLFPTREIIDPETGESDTELVVWFCDIEEDKQSLYNQYGYMFTNYKTSTKEYQETIQSVFELISQGPSLFRLDAFLSAISGSPIIKEAKELVEKIEKTPEGALIITDKNVYTLDSLENIRSSIKVGDILKGGTPLSKAVEIIDTRKKLWWQKLVSLPLKKGGSSNVDQFISFPNKLVSAEYGKSILFGDNRSYSVRFDLIGNKLAIEKFWKNVFKKAKESVSFYGYELYKKYADTVDPLSEFVTKPEFFVNPAQIFADDLLGGSVLPIKINFEKVKDLEFFFRTVNPLTSNTPIHIILMVFFEFDLLEEKNLNNAQGKSGVINLRHFLDQNISSFPTQDKTIWEFDVEDESIKEGLSTGRSFGNIAQNPNPYYQDRVIENFDLSNVNNLVQNIELKIIKKCKT
jgi:hypothetical protein